jgi:hypothetical protein
MQYGMIHMHPIHQTAHADACKIYRTAYTVVSLRMNPRGSKHVGDNRNYKLIINLENCDFICMCCIMCNE